MKKNKIIAIIVLCALLLVGGGTLAYFNSRHTNVTSLTTKVYSTQSTQEYTSPENFLPGTLVNMNTKVENTGEVTVAVRAKIEESWTSRNNASLPLYQTRSNKYYRTILFNTNESQECLTTACATDITSINADWTYSNGYYYYKNFLDEDDETSSLVNSILFNSYIENDISCSTDALTGDNVCSSTGNGYDDATYNLTITFETVQSDAYAAYWNTNVSITEKVESPVQLVNGTGLNPGDEISINNEHFYILSNDGTDVKAIAKYNLYVGGDYNSSTDVRTEYGSEATGLQDPSMKGAIYEDTIYRGVLRYGPANEDPSNLANIIKLAPPRINENRTPSSCEICALTDNYETYLKQFVPTLTASVPVVADIETIGSGNNQRYSSQEDDPWLYSTYYWLNEAVSNAPFGLWHGVYADGINGGSYPFDTDDIYGLRPIIEFASSLIESD